MENVKVARNVAQTDIFVSFQRRFGHFYLLVGINMITHVVATFGEAVCDFFRKLRKRYCCNLESKMGWMGLITCHYCLRLQTVANGIYPKRLFSGRSALIGIVTITYSARFKGLAFLNEIPL